jgi:hypothetical protein
MIMDTKADYDEIADEILDNIERRKKDFAATVRPGDVVYASKDERFTFSKFRYCTQGKGYVVQSIEEDTVSCEGDIKGEGGLYLCSLSATHVERDGEIIWDSRGVMTFRYRRDLEHDTDRCGSPVDLEAVYQGRWLNYYSHDEGDGSILVELITPFREGQPGDLIVVNESDMEILEIAH